MVSKTNNFQLILSRETAGCADHHNIRGSMRCAFCSGQMVFPATMTHSACVVPKLRGGSGNHPEPPEHCSKQRSCSRPNQCLRIGPCETRAKGESAWTQVTGK